MVQNAPGTGVADHSGRSSVTRNEANPDPLAALAAHLAGLSPADRERLAELLRAPADGAAGST